MNIDLEYAKADDVATKPDFNIVRFQLINAIKTHKAHQLPTITRDSGKSWNLVMEIMVKKSEHQPNQLKNPNQIVVSKLSIYLMERKMRW